MCGRPQIAPPDVHHQASQSNRHGSGRFHANEPEHLAVPHKVIRDDVVGSRHVGAHRCTNADATSSSWTYCIRGSCPGNLAALSRKLLTAAWSVGPVM